MGLAHDDRGTEDTLDEVQKNDTIPNENKILVTRDIGIAHAKNITR